MSKAVEGVTEKIEECAKKEFKSKGYVEASLRTIAMEAGTPVQYIRDMVEKKAFFQHWWSRQQESLRKFLRMSRNSSMRWRVTGRKKALMNTQEME